MHLAYSLALQRGYRVADLSVVYPIARGTGPTLAAIGEFTAEFLTVDGKLAYPSTGDVIDVATRKIVAHLTDETGAAVQSEKMLEIDFRGPEPFRAGDQFGIGRKQ